MDACVDDHGKRFCPEPLGHIGVKQHSADQVHCRPVQSLRYPMLLGAIQHGQLVVDSTSVEVVSNDGSDVLSAVGRPEGPDRMSGVSLRL